ncbi:MAG: DUF1127 domain-containing protein [Ferrovibrio sp.]|uniref:DUF1127 domain-containing protein n=1 Tax=Ferrovibrio sp. TaxID=1917215 RepID=UPI002602ABFA|nr:DUF1127 domain-containing protein [Ferrovibrio sp.]MCW0235549.1 DUF1127 domain-containing protein [Ferrovibrio sp.]
MTTIAPSAPQTIVKKHDRSDALQQARRLQPTGERPAWLGARPVLSPTKAELGWLDGISNPAVFDGLAAPWWQLTLPALSALFAGWAQRTRARRELTRIDARSLRDAGISPGAAAFEAAQHFWQAPIELRDYPSDKATV